MNVIQVLLWFMLFFIAEIPGIRLAPLIGFWAYFPAIILGLYLVQLGVRGLVRIFIHGRIPDDTKEDSRRPPDP